MAKRHGKKRDKEEKPPPAEQRISVVEALRRVHEVMSIIMCNTCERKDTCVNRIVCTLYSDKPPKCPVCGEIMDKYHNTFVCSKCALEDMKKKRMEELE